MLNEKLPESSETTESITLPCETRDTFALVTAFASDVLTYPISVPSTESIVDAPDMPLVCPETGEAIKHTAAIATTFVMCLRSISISFAEGFIVSLAARSNWALPNIAFKLSGVGEKSKNFEFPSQIPIQNTPKPERGFAVIGPLLRLATDFSNNQRSKLSHIAAFLILLGQ